MNGSTEGRLSFAVRVVRSVLDRRVRMILGPVEGTGRTARDAGLDLRARVLAALDSLDTDPAFARDDDGSLIVAVQTTAGVVHWKIPADGGAPRQIAGCDGPPRASLEGTYHYTILEA